MRWILLDQAGVQVYPVFVNKPYYAVNGKDFAGSELAAIFSTEEYHEYNLGHRTEESLIKLFIQRQKGALTPLEFRQLLRSSIEPIPGMPALIERLSKRYKLAAAINEGREWAYLKLDVPNLRQYFNKLIISGEIGKEKPNMDFYLETLGILPARPSECIFVDDKEENCTAARKVGIDSICFTGADQLKQELLKRKVL